MFVGNLVIVAQICPELLHGQAEFPRILSQNSQNNLEGQVQLSSFSTPSESTLWRIFGANLMIITHISDELLHRKPNFLEFWVKMAKMTLNVKVNDLHFQYQLRVSRDACLVEIWWFQFKSVTSHRSDKAKFTHKQTDRQMDRTRQRQYPFGLKGQGVENEGRPSHHDH